MTRSGSTGFVLISAVAAALLTSGCHTIVRPVAQGPLPLGAAVAPFVQTMETNGEAMDFVIHQHEWIGTTAQLTPAGQTHLMQIARRLADVPYPVIIEPVTFRPFDDKQHEEKHFTDMNRERREALELDLARRQNLDADRRAEIDAARRQEVVQFLASTRTSGSSSLHLTFAV